MRVLVTGGSGYVGSHAVRQLADAGHEIVSIDLVAPRDPEALGSAEIVIGDIRDALHLAELFERHRFAAVLHFAALKSAEESMDRPGDYFQTNVGGTIALLEAMRGSGVEQIVFSSSCAIYGSPTASPVAEDEPARPASPYGASKAMAEEILSWFDGRHGIRSVCLRYFNAAGAAPGRGIGEDWDTSRTLIPNILRAALANAPPVSIHGTDYPSADGTTVRDYVHVLDLADGHLRALDHLARGGSSIALNLGSGRGVSTLEVLAAAREVTGVDIPARVGPRRAGDPVALWADVTRARTVLGWEPTRSLQDILESAWRWHCSGTGDRSPSVGAA